MCVSRLWIGILVFAACVFAAPLGAQEASPAATAPASAELARLLLIEEGETPIILSAPHGGGRAIRGVAAREGKGVEQFVTVTDVNTHRLAEAVARELTERWGKPHLVIARFSRRYIDANRPAEQAYESEAARPVYDAYHDALRRAVTKTRERWGRGLLIDLHGQSAGRSTIFRGTADGKTCSLLLERLGPDALMGSSGVLGMLHARGYAIEPPPGSRAREDRRYNGGHIVRTYGASAGTGVDAVQLELGGDFRQEGAIEKTAEDLAECVCKFADVYFAESRKEAEAK